MGSNAQKVCYVGIRSQLRILSDAFEGKASVTSHHQQALGLFDLIFIDQNVSNIWTIHATLILSSHVMVSMKESIENFLLSGLLSSFLSNYCVVSWNCDSQGLMNLFLVFL